MRFVRLEAGDLVTLFLYLYEFVYEVYDFAYDNLRVHHFTRNSAAVRLDLVFRCTFRKQLIGLHFRQSAILGIFVVHASYSWGPGKGSHKRRT